jgi:hypothetical protein
MHERLVTPSKTAPVVFNALRWHRRVAELGMAFDVRRFSVLSVVPRGLESVVEALPGYLRKSRWRRWFHIDRVGMRTSSQKDGQQQRGQSKPFLHAISSRVGFVVSPIPKRDAVRF